MYSVSKDGRSPFSSIQAAVDALPENPEEPSVLLIHVGEYHERVIIHRNHVRIIGESMEDTIITHSACARDLDQNGQEKGTFLSFSVLVTGHDVTIENLTIRNDAGDGSIAGQAVALYAAGDRGTYRGCRLIAHQDTLFCGPLMPRVEKEIAPYISTAECVPSVGDCPPTHSRQYFEDCFIQGDIDFIFGPYRCWFERCTLFMNARGGWYTAANTPREQRHGLVFHACHLTGECKPGQAYLGRPWRPYARTVFLCCDMDEHVSPQGFVDWDAPKPVTERCGEWNTIGTQSDQSTRHPRQRRLTKEEAQEITLVSVLGGNDHWQPNESYPEDAHA